MPPCLRTILAAALIAGAAPAAADLPVAGEVMLSGYAVAVGRRTGPLLLDSAGAAELSPDGDAIRPMTADTPVRIASVSKLALALAIHRLADRDLLALDDDASAHLGWRLRNPAHPDAPVTIRQLLRHESSLSDAGGYGGRLGERLRDTLGPKSWSAAPPGTAFDYANLNSAILAEIVEARTGERFDRAMQALVFQPLGVRACFNWSACPPGHAEAGAVLYRKSSDHGASWQPDGPWVAQVDSERPAGNCPVRRADGAACALDGYAPGTNGGLFGPQGGLRISVAELARLGQALLRNEGGFLSPRARSDLFRRVPVRAGGDGEETDVRLMRFWSAGGLHCFSGDGRPGGDQPTAPAVMPGCGHLGEAYGLFSALVLDPKGGTVMAWAMTGSAEKPRPGAVSRFNASEEALAARTRRMLLQHGK